MYLLLVSSRRPIGPRAWSFCVEIPISQPRPNTPPSVKRVDALTYTAAESTARVNFAAAASSDVTMASEWPVEWRAMCATASSRLSTTRTARM